MIKLRKVLEKGRHYFTAEVTVFANGSTPQEALFGLVGHISRAVDRELIGIQAKEKRSSDESL
jgi:hypothetical protein